MSTPDVANLWGVLGGAFGASLGVWARERRLGRKDQYDFALELIKTQERRLDELTQEVGRLQARVDQLLEENAALRMRVVDSLEPSPS